MPSADHPGRAPNHALRALLRESEWTQEALARTIAALGAEAGIHLRYDRTSVAHWLRGSRPAPRVRQLLAEALSRRLGRLVTPAELGMGDAPAPQRSRAATGPADRLAALTNPVVGPPRADTPPAAPYQLTLLTRPPGVRQAPQPRPSRSLFPSAGRGGRTVRRTSPDEVASVREHARFFAQQADRHGGGHIRTPLAASLGGLVRRLRTGGEGPHHAQLLAGAARLSYLLARVYADEQRNGLAQRAFLTAAELAEEGGDLEGVALVRRALSSQAHQLGHTGHSLALAESACETAPPDAEPSARAFLYAGLAVARAAGGERAPAMEALRRAEHELARAPVDLTTGPESPNTEPVGSYQDAALMYQASQVRVALGDRAGAIGELRSSLRSRPAGERRSRALSHAELAELLLSLGRLEEACAAWQVFLEDCTFVRSGRTRRARDRMPRLLHPYSGEKCVQVLLQRFP